MTCCSTWSRRSRWSTCARRGNTAASCCTCLIILRKARCAAGTFRARRTSRGPKPCSDDGTFKSAAELKELYQSQGIVPEKEVIAYCRIGERSSHTWFVLTYLLGYPNVRNYDGSWTEWGNLVGVPIEK